MFISVVPLGCVSFIGAGSCNYAPHSPGDVTRTLICQNQRSSSVDRIVAWKWKAGANTALYPLNAKEEFSEVATVLITRSILSIGDCLLSPSLAHLLTQFV
jgi:hypothetical protein